MIMKYLKSDFEKMFDENVEDVSLKNDVKYVYVSDNEFVGCEYDDGMYSIVGLGMDRFCDYYEMINMLRM